MATSRGVCPCSLYSLKTVVVKKATMTCRLHLYDTQSWKRRQISGWKPNIFLSSRDNKEGVEKKTLRKLLTPFCPTKRRQSFYLHFVWPHFHLLLLYEGRFSFPFLKFCWQKRRTKANIIPRTLTSH
jgi:hypothetical protein